MKHASLLAAELAAVRGELGRIDGKCSVLAGLAGAAAAFTATQVNGPTPVVVRMVFAFAGVVLAAAAVVLLVMVIRPRLGATGFCRYAEMPDEELRDLFRHGRSDWQYLVHDGNRPAGVEADTIELADLKVLSELVKRKNQRLQLAVGLITTGVVLVGVAVLAGVIT